MAEIKIIDGRLLSLGPNLLNNFGITEWDFIKVGGEDGSDFFLPKNKSPKKMTSYLREALGQQVRLFYVETPTSNGEKEAALLAIEMESGKSFTLAGELDKAKSDGKKAVFMGYVSSILLFAFSIVSILTVIGALIGVPLLFKWWTFHKTMIALKAPRYTQVQTAAEPA